MIILAAFVVLYCFLYIAGVKGIGFFWDWNWPIFRDQLGSFFASQNSAWINYNGGQTLQYASSYYLNYVISLTRFLHLQPEIVLYLLLVILSSLASFGAYLISKTKLSPILSFLIGLAVVANPAYLYKLEAGHFSYLASYTIFIYFIYFLFFLNKNNLKSALILGIFLALVGFQIQFFIFAFIALFVYYLFNIQKLSGRYILLACFLALLINLPWLSNFIIGANSLSVISGQAGSIAFSGASRASILRIALMAFSDATLIRFYYPKYIFAFFGLFSLGISLLALWRLKKWKLPGDLWAIIVALLIYVFLATGVYQNWGIPVVRLIYPMLREVGHLAPVIIFFIIFLLIKLMPKITWARNVIFGYLIIFIAINAITIFKSLPLVNYEALRGSLLPYKEFLAGDSANYRILSYPFFGQYSVVGEAAKEVSGQPVRNTGIDPFTQSSLYETVSNYVPAQSIDQTVQYRLMSTYDISELERMNVKYLLDFSSIYQSNIEKYSDPSYYHNNLSIIKNDPEFFNKLITHNPGRISEIAPNIYKLKDASSRITLDGEPLQAQQINPAEYHLRVQSLADFADLDLSVASHPAWQLYFLDENGNKRMLNTQNKEIKSFGMRWNLSAEQIKKELKPEFFAQNSDGSLKLNLELIFVPQKYFRVSVYISLLTLLVTASGIALLSRRHRG